MKKKPMKTTSLDVLTDKYIGKKGTPKRESFENELRLDFCVEKAYHDLIKEIEELPEKDRIRKWLGMFA